MPNPRMFQIQEIPAHPGSVSGAGVRREAKVCKYIEVTTCLGCKACQVARAKDLFLGDCPERRAIFEYRSADVVRPDYSALGRGPAGNELLPVAILARLMSASRDSRLTGAGSSKPGSASRTGVRVYERFHFPGFERTHERDAELLMKRVCAI